MKVLHIGCGRVGKELKLPDYPDAEIITLDADERLKPDIVCKLGIDKIALEDDSIDLVVAIHVLEHIGRQGEVGEWFQFWEEIYRVLKPNGFIHFESPLYSSVWCWADPTHSRALSPQAFVFFAQGSYRIKDSSISPYRIKCDFSPVGFEVVPDKNEEVRKLEQYSHLLGELKAIKPLHPWWEDEQKPTEERNTL